MPTLAEGVRATAFFAGFLPSFTRIGHCVRRAGWVERTGTFDGQRWVVTGASTGIGREIARQAALAGATVFAVARSRERLDALAAECAGARGAVRPIALDLSLVAGTDQLLDELLPAFGPVDVLVNNVGVLPDRPATTPEGLDQAFATNLLNPWLLARGLIDRGLAAPDAAIINMSSGGMYNVALEVARLEAEQPYAGALAYARHKRAQVALNALLVDECASRGSRIRCYAMHPGWVDTPGVETSMPLFHQLLKPILRNPTEGADTALWLAERRPPARVDGIWFDRALRPAHVFAGTRNGDTVANLVRFLDRRANDARGVPANAHTR